MKLSQLKIKGKNYLGLEIPYDRALIDRAKSFGGHWLATRKKWLFPYSTDLRRELEQAFHLENKAHRKESFIPAEYLALLERKRYSPNTIQTYCCLFGQFLTHYKEIEPTTLTDQHVADFQTYLVKEKRVATSTQNQYINAIKFYFEKVLGREKKYYQIDRPIKEFKLPKVLSEGEVISILEAITNLKHRAMLYMVYSSGLRAGELIHLRLSDIDSEQMRVFVRGGKGKKDRVTILSQRALNLLRAYFIAYKPKEYLFEGKNGGIYSSTSLRKVFEAALLKSGIGKKATLHSLRHSFATHLMDRGTNLRYIQELLGHRSSQTTEIYTHISNKGLSGVISPLDRLTINESNNHE